LAPLHARARADTLVRGAKAASAFVRAIRRTARMEPCAWTISSVAAIASACQASSAFSVNSRPIHATRIRARQTVCAAQSTQRNTCAAATRATRASTVKRRSTTAPPRPASTAPV
jgi:hypothetical protein